MKRDGGGEQLSGVHLLIRCGRNIATFEYFAADLSDAAVHELTALTATAVDHLQAIPR